jgi:nucleotide-binding universal stress UspA family protein
MKKLSAIVVAIDFSSSSAQMLAHGAKLASGLGCPLIAAHVISESRLRDWTHAMDRELVVDERVRHVTERLRGLAADVCGGLEVGIEVRFGRPYQQLGKIVNEHGADLLLIGAHDVSRQHLGPVAGRCARSMPSDLLILRDWQEKFFQKITACVDFMPTSAAVMERAISLAEIHQASLEITHVIYPPDRDPWGEVLEGSAEPGADYVSAVRGRAAKDMATLLEPFVGRLSRIQSSELFLEGESPGAAITAHVHATESDLTVMGSHSGSWLEDFVLGSNTERLMNESSSSVMIVR